MNSRARAVWAARDLGTGVDANHAAAGSRASPLGTEEDMMLDDLME